MAGTAPTSTAGARPRPPAPSPERVAQARRDLLEAHMTLEVVLSSLKAAQTPLSPAQLTVLCSTLDETCDVLSGVGERLK